MCCLYLVGGLAELGLPTGPLTGQTPLGYSLKGGAPGAPPNNTHATGCRNHPIGTGPSCASSSSPPDTWPHALPPGIQRRSDKKLSGPFNKNFAGFCETTAFMAPFITSLKEINRTHVIQLYIKGKLRPQLFLQKVVWLKPDQPDQLLRHWYSAGRGNSHATGLKAHGESGDSLPSPH